MGSVLGDCQFPGMECVGNEKEFLEVVFHIGPWKIVDGREKIDWICGSNCVLKLSDRGKDYNFRTKRTKINEVASLFFDTRGR